MAKKGFFVLVLALFAAGGIFAQAKGAKVAPAKKNLITLDLAPLFKGIVASDGKAKDGFFGLGAEYDRALGKSLSLGARLDLVAGKKSDLSVVYFGMALHGRYYLSAVLEKAFLDAGLGFNTASMEGNKLFSGLSFELKAGYTVPLGKLIRLEPSLAYIYAKGGNFPTPLGWQLGLGLGIAL